MALAEGAPRESRPHGDRDGRGRTAHIRRPRRPRLQALTEQRVAVVTGASSGIGEAIARALAARGWHTILLARREDRLRALAAELEGEYEVCDVSDRAAVARVAAAIRERHRQIHLLVNNAGIPGRAGFLEITPERIEEVLRVNYLGTVWCLREFLPALEAAGRSDVVNIVSVAGTVAWGSGAYSASKHALLAFSRAATAELWSRGVHVHTVNPGFVETEGFPQATVLGSALLRRAVVGPDRVARHVLRVLDRDRRETFVPGWYRVAAIAQALAPGLVSRARVRFAGRRMRA